MPLDLSKLRVLHTKMQNGENSANVFDYFTIHFSNQAFINASQAIPRLPVGLNEAVTVALQQVTKDKRLKLRELAIQAIPDYQFYHGLAIADNTMAPVLYFDDLATGIVAVLHISDIAFARFSLLKESPPVKPSDISLN